MIIFRSLLTTFEVSHIFEAVGSEVKIGSSLNQIDITRLSLYKSLISSLCLTSLVLDVLGFGTFQAWLAAEAALDFEDIDSFETVLRVTSCTAVAAAGHDRLSSRHLNMNFKYKR